MNWDKYFIEISKKVAQNSKCMSRKIGAVLVKDKAIISTGYNGPPRGAKHCDERPMQFYRDLENIEDLKSPLKGDYPNKGPRRILGYKSGEGLHLCSSVHAERNTLIQAARNGISTKDTTLYMNCPYPCKDCTIEIINAGVKRIVCTKREYYDRYSKVLLEESDIKVDAVEV